MAPDFDAPLEDFGLQKDTQRNAAAAAYSARARL